MKRKCNNIQLTACKNANDSIVESIGGRDKRANSYPEPTLKSIFYLERIHEDRYAVFPK
jgi:hypothetical protein